MMLPLVQWVLNKMWLVPDLRMFLEGTWRVDRSLHDRRNAIDGQFRGVARFVGGGTTLLYEEGGTLDFGAHHASASQHFRYDFPRGCRQAQVKFRDGRLFHELDLSAGQAAVSHECSPDLYRGRFMALSPRQWQCSWTVSGPRKDQEISSLYTRSD